MPGTGYVDALEALRACTEDVATVQPDSPFVDDKVIKYFIREIIGREIDPDEIRSLWLYKAGFWQVVGKVRDVLVVIYTERGEKYRLISARLANKREEDEYYGQYPNL